MSKYPGSLEKQYCIGCGLCKSRFGADKADVVLNEKGFYEPCLHLTQEEYATFQGFCPVNVPPAQYSSQVWGERKHVCLGHAANEEVRLKASSGGVLTAVCGFLLQSGLVEGIIQLGDSERPLYKTSRISRNLDELLQCAGSRYVAAMPLEQVLQMLEAHPEQKFALVGRPCDIRAMRSYLRNHPQIQPQLVCLLSFFCAGTPSVNASKRMIAQMGADEQKVTHVSYRGNGWPGYSTVRDMDGKEYTMDYEASWGRILGRDIYRGCRLCYDGIGEEADISCGDAWYLDENGKVTFDERPGRNVIFARTEIGARILQQAQAQGWILCEDFDERLLNKMQPFQYVRKAQLYYKLLALRTIGRDTPAVQLSKIRHHCKRLSLKESARMYLGTIRRALQNKM